MTDRAIVEQHIRNIVNECIQEEMEYRNLRRIVKEEISRIVYNRLNEGDDISTKRNTVMNMLKNDKFKHSILAYELWNPKDDSEKDVYRSLFSKKATGKPDADGNVRSFTDEEIVKLYELLRSK